MKHLSNFEGNLFLQRSLQTHLTLINEIFSNKLQELEVESDSCWMFAFKALTAGYMGSCLSFFQMLEVVLGGRWVKSKENAPGCTEVDCFRESQSSLVTMQFRQAWDSLVLILSSWDCSFCFPTFSLHMSGSQGVVARSVG